LLYADDVPITNRLEVTHTGVGLAWSYFYGYLNIVLPGLFNCPDLRITRYAYRCDFNMLFFE